MHAAGLLLEPIVPFARPVLDDLLHLRRQSVGWQLQQRLRLTALAHHVGAGPSRDAQHRRVLAQCMDQQRLHATIARVQRGEVE